MHKHQWRRIALIVAAVLVVIILVPLLFINTYLTPKLSKKLKAAVITASDGLYRIDFSKAELHVLQGKAVLYDITLLPDTAVYHRMKKQGTAPGELYELRVKQLLISDAHPFKLYFHKQLEIGEIILTNPGVQVSQYDRGDKKPAPKDSRTLYQKLSKSLRSIRVGAINLNDIQFSYKTFIGPKPETGMLRHMNLKVTDLLIDSATQHDRSRTLFCKEIETRLDHFHGTTADGLYQFKFRSIRLSTRLSRLTMTGLTMLPLPSKAFFAKSKLDHFNLYLDSVSVNDINLQSLRMTPDLDITKMTVSKGHFSIYPNPNVPPKKTDRIVTFPNSVLGHMKSILSVDTLNLQHIDVSYTEYNKASGEAGTITFNNTSARFLHISNKKEKVARYPWSTVHLTTYVMGKGKFNLAVGFKLNDNREPFNYTGHLGPIDLKDGNSVLMPLGLARAQSGNVQSLDFSVAGTQKTTKGKVTFLYNDLKVELLRHNEKGYSKRTLITLLANLIVLKNNNPDNAQTAPRSANVVFVRPASTPFFKSMWQTILSGIKPCAGLGKADAPPAKPLTEKEQKKQDKALKKAKKKADKAEKQFKKQQEEIRSKKAK
jgi:hypothetical protein